MDDGLPTPPCAATRLRFPRHPLATICCMLGGCVVTGTPALGADTNALEPNAQAPGLPAVVTPTRLRQPLRDVPASVTVITADMLRRLGILSVADALRLVPGMQVTESAGSRILINYHGTNNRDPRRLNVLVDGISVYRPGFARIYWMQLPVAIEDIERIEVTRSPSSAAYGPNSMMAVVNIVSKHPADVERASITGGAGSQERRWIHTRLARNIGPTSIHLAASAEDVGGFDSFDGEPGHDTTRAKRLLVRSSTDLGERAQLDLEAAYVEGRNEIPFRSQFEAYPDERLRDTYLGATLAMQLSATHELQLRGTYSHHRNRQEWATCFPQVVFLPELFAMWQSNPGYANAVLMGQIPSGGTPVDDQLAARAIVAVQRLGAAALQPLCGFANQNLTESRTDFELQDTYVWSDRLRLVSGIGARVHRATSETFLGGTVSNRLYRLFGNLEYKPAEPLTVNVGAYAEHDRIVGWSLAPRIGVNVHVAPGRSLRFAVSKGIRTPDLVEQHGNFTYTLRGSSVPGPDGSLTPRFYQSARSPGDMRNEESISKEAGFLLSEPRWGLMLDLKVFEDRLKRLISQPVTVAGFAPTNDNSTTLRGAEVQASMAWSPAWSAFFNYAYLDNSGATIFWERTQYSRHSGAVGVSHSLGAGWRWSLAYYGASGDGIGESRYGRTDLTIGRRFTAGASTAEAGLTLRHLDNATTTYILSAPVRRSSLDARTQGFAWLRVSF